MNCKKRACGKSTLQLCDTLILYACV